ncbi:MAG: outer membrane beta-barrel protein [Paludibacteraceae bacterium]|nr:outer membrane beta-barrel protein [Paludibacteraceae bacterium]
MKTRLCLFLLLMAFVPLGAQNPAANDNRTRMQQIQQQSREQFERAKQQIREWDTEQRLDSIDQERLPKIVSGGLLLNANISNFIIANRTQTWSSYMHIGADLGGFIDFRVTKHFAIQGRLLFTAESNRFEADKQDKHLWSFGMDIPVFFMGRFGNMDKGYLQFGAGPFTHFTFASNVNVYTNNEAAQASPARLPQEEAKPDYSSLYALHDNHSGIAVTIGYEFPIGIQINANYQVSLSDILTFYHQNKGSDIANAAIYPQRVSLGIGYRWK